MSKKQDAKKSKKAEVDLSPEETRELEMILDRLAVQNPEGGSFDNYLRSLKKALENQENLMAALLDALSRNASAVSFRVFQTLQDAVSDSKYRKLIKKAAFRFSQKGFHLEDTEQKAERIVLVHKETREPVAHLFPVEGAFTMIAALIPENDLSPSPILVTVFDQDGLQRMFVRLTETSSSLYRDYLATVEKHLSKKRRVCEIPIWHAARLFFEMIEFTEPRSGVAEIENAKRLFMPYYDPQRQPYAYELMPELEHPEIDVREVDARALLEEVGGPWLMFSKEELAPYEQKMSTMTTSVLVVAPAVQAERQEELLAMAADELCVGRTRKLYQRFFEEQALWMKQVRMDDLAMASWAVSQHLRSGAPGSTNPVVLDLITTSMMVHWPEVLGKEGESPEQFRRTEGGLILPP